MRDDIWGKTPIYYFRFNLIFVLFVITSILRLYSMRSFDFAQCIGMGISSIHNTLGEYCYFLFRVGVLPHSTLLKRKRVGNHTLSFFCVNELQSVTVEFWQKSTKIAQRKNWKHCLQLFWPPPRPRVDVRKYFCSYSPYAKLEICKFAWLVTIRFLVAHITFFKSKQFPQKLNRLSRVSALTTLFRTGLSIFYSPLANFFN